MTETPERPNGTSSRRPFLRKALTALVGTVLTLSTGIAALASHPAAAQAPSRISGAVVVDWNKELVRILATPGAQPATIHPTRSFAILHAAIYDAVVSITHSNVPYLFSLDAPAGARPDAAAAEAGHDTLAALYPSVKGALDQQLAGELAAIPDGTAKKQGIEVGHLAAALMLAARADDGASVPPPPLPPSTQPGAYRPTPPFVNGAAFTQWAAVTPFVLQRADQFRPAPPPGLTTAAYAQAVNEVKSLGQATSTTRTPDQTVIAKFWPGPIWTTWNEIAENSALAHHADLAHTARLFALLNLSFADTVIAFYDAKYHYTLWRPVTAIREAAGAGNPAVTADPTWSPLLTASDPSYPGAHSAISAAGAAVLTSFFGKHDRITVTSDVLPGVTRSFASYSAAATEAGLSRIYGGVHYRFDHEAGLRLGQDVATFVLREAASHTFGLRAS
ncbi:MAG: vanadium-dependent haloperoxidase [Chloroflexi bacterium]|nr:vanadium-dependent haloperoxidase [Chloroflexota bacterium]